VYIYILLSAPLYTPTPYAYYAVPAFLCAASIFLFIAALMLL